jgi:hypothetical protein
MPNLNVLPIGDVALRYVPKQTSEDSSTEVADFVSLITRLQNGVMTDDVRCVVATLDALTTMCPIMMGGLADDAGRLLSLPRQEQGSVLCVIWMIVQAEVMRFASQRARSSRLPYEEREKVVDQTEIKIIKRLQSSAPPSFSCYGQFAAYINRATTNAVRSARAKLARRPIIGSLTGKDYLPMRPVLGRWPKKKKKPTTAAPKESPAHTHQEPNLTNEHTANEKPPVIEHEPPGEEGTWRSRVLAGCGEPRQ